MHDRFRFKNLHQVIEQCVGAQIIETGRTYSQLM